MKAIIKNPHNFEQDILEVLKKWGYNTRLITKLDIKFRLEKLPVIKIVYNKQYRSLDHKVAIFINRLKRKLKVIK